MFCEITKSLSLIQVSTAYMAPQFVLDPQFRLKYIFCPCKTFITTFKFDISQSDTLSAEGCHSVWIIFYWIAL